MNADDEYPPDSAFVSVLLEAGVQLHKRRAHTICDGRAAQTFLQRKLADPSLLESFVNGMSDHLGDNDALHNSLLPVEQARGTISTGVDSLCRLLLNVPVIQTQRTRHARTHTLR